MSFRKGKSLFVDLIKFMTGWIFDCKFRFQTLKNTFILNNQFKFQIVKKNPSFRQNKKIDLSH